MKLSELLIRRAASSYARTAVILLFACAVSASAQTNYVATTGNDETGDGTESKPWLTISNAVAKTGSGNTVLVSTGVYNVTVEIKIDEELTVRSWNPPDKDVQDRENTIIASDETNAVLYLNHADALFSGFTITGGGGVGGDQGIYKPDESGGGVFIGAGTLSNCIVAGNTTSFRGAGIYMAANTLVTDCVIKHNDCDSAILGGGIYAWSGSSVLNTHIISNIVLRGEGIGIKCYDNVIISNCVIAGNAMTTEANIGKGGGVDIWGTNVLIVDSVISNNFSGLVGGAISVYDSGFVTLRDSTIIANEARYSGGGISVRTDPSGGAYISNSVISHNIAPGRNGGGIAVGYWGTTDASEGMLTVVDSRISNNSAKIGGGAWIYTHGTATFHNCEIVDNILPVVSTRGAGMHIGTGSYHVVVQNSLIAGNSATDGNSHGGGISFSGSSSGVPGPNPLDVRIESCTIVDNEVQHSYGGMNVIPGHVQVFNTLVVSNQAGSFPDLEGGAENIASFHYSCSPVLTNAEQGNITNAPVFVDFGAGNYRLAHGSPGINSGTNQSWMPGAVDLDGRARIDRFSGVVDMGCYEYISRGIFFYTY